MDITGPIPKNARGRFYHLDCAPGDLASYILTCGDPSRAQAIARRLTRVDMRRKNREFLTYTGIYQNIPVSVMATGIGAPASAIAIVEAANCVTPVTFIRLGTCGALSERISQVGDLVITAVGTGGDENTTHAICPGGFRPPGGAGRSWRPSARRPTPSRRLTTWASPAPRRIFTPARAGRRRGFPPRTPNT